jgi:hypothetical protein
MGVADREITPAIKALTHYLAHMVYTGERDTFTSQDADNYVNWYCSTKLRKSPTRDIQSMTDKILAMRTKGATYREIAATMGLDKDTIYHYAAKAKMIIGSENIA